MTSALGIRRKSIPSRAGERWTRNSVGGYSDTSRGRERAPSRISASPERKETASRGEAPVGSNAWVLAKGEEVSQKNRETTTDAWARAKGED
jgi:hypothetical protein